MICTSTASTATWHFFFSKQCLVENIQRKSVKKFIGNFYILLRNYLESETFILYRNLNFFIWNFCIPPLFSFNKILGILSKESSWKSDTRAGWYINARTSLYNICVYNKIGNQLLYTTSFLTCKGKQLTFFFHYFLEHIKFLFSRFLFI